MTHDFFAACRARLDAVALLRADQIPRTQIAAGFDYDSWTQIEQTGYLNVKRLKNPRGAFRPFKDPSCKFHTFVFDWMPSITPKYVVLVDVGESVPAGLNETKYPVIRYRTWLSPFSHDVRILENTCR
jgi:hypothetical protein